MRGVLPEIGWFSSNERTLGRTLRSSVEVKNEKPQVNVLCLLPSDGSMSPTRCHVDENHPISGMLRGSDCITAIERKLFCCSKGREFHRCNRRLAGMTLFDSTEVALANELSPEIELLSLDGVAFFEVCNGRVVSRASVE